jgi:hypothetical protein
MYQTHRITSNTNNVKLSESCCENHKVLTVLGHNGDDLAITIDNNMADKLSTMLSGLRSNTVIAIICDNISIGISDCKQCLVIARFSGSMAYLAF